MRLNNKQYYINSLRTVVFGSCSISIGLFVLCLLFLTIPYFDISYLFLIPIAGIISITTIYFGSKILIQFNKFVQLELHETELKYLIIGTGKGSALNYFINPSFKTLKYSNIKFINIIRTNFEKHIEIIQNDDSKIVIFLLFKNEKELEEIILEIKNRLN
ncbi:hypothetical protein NAL32_05630 [Chryseobacterium sp. Ch-15]|uniref:Uncharacterized protein n=1 Tax=Chryseobacterium muglaense TaxID=2893752 RepID=A0A9Q3USU1_9FLAO|nr:hypothetical protein [Chryseobacterium muglaense]MBD3904049.1 hypothetical protein [Chryseobacterium muglaense]MCC9033378.1 hypothetical protein [Chryseobacterium muglaense]MCM2553873.1 hypothetical protein [Chryseobacterium muglaense]